MPVLTHHSTGRLLKPLPLEPGKRILHELIGLERRLRAWGLKEEKDCDKPCLVQCRVWVFSPWEAQGLNFQRENGNWFLLIFDSQEDSHLQKVEGFLWNSTFPCYGGVNEFTLLGRDDFLSWTFIQICGVQMFTETYRTDRTPGLIGPYGV